ncbi:MAG TPA: porin family protein [Gemmatimonadales bacterium]|nr:porin family protein [Gemmatimonadales bacterium]
MMLRLAGSLVLAALMTAPAAAQKRRAPTGQMAVFGPQAGVNFARFGGGDVGSVDSRTGIQVGMFAAFPLGKYFAISPAVAYAQEGTSVDVGGGLSGTFKLDYIEVPVLLKLGAPLQGSGRLRPWVAAGPALGFRVGCRLAASSGTQSAEADCDDNQVGLKTKAVQFSTVFGGGIDIGQVSVGLRYQLGMTSIDDTGSDADIRNRVLAIVAGYAFRLGH